ncbi:MAG TPA: arylsulfatase [Candidatus Brocadiia bacterium]|nr:arylsulfatase [Candidatus Brocadiia bacterium]
MKAIGIRALTLAGGAGCAANVSGEAAQPENSPRDQAKSTQPPSRPNIILIMVDDMGFSDLGCYGSEIRTPNLDALAGGGIRFSQFYNAARCCPTRASLLTGLYPHQAGIGGMVKSDDSMPAGPYQGYLNENCATIAEALKPAGYNTLMSGKWHVGECRPHWPTDRGFDRFFGLVSGGANYFDIRKCKAPGIVRKMALEDQPYSPPSEGFYMTDAITDYAVRMVNEYSGKPNPFFLYTAYTAPHWPLHALPEDIAKYKGKYMSGWEVLRKARHKRQIEIGLLDARWPLTPLDEEAPDWPGLDNKELMDLKMAVYAAQIDRMDQGVGRIMDALRKNGQEENTLVLFLSDNGGCAEGGPLGFDNRNNGLPPGGVDSYMSYGLAWANASNTPFRLYKHWVHEGGISTPLIAHWPAAIKQHGVITNQPGHIIDLMATCLDVAGAEYPKERNGKPVSPLEGKSLKPILEGKQREGHEFIFWEHEKHEAVRWGKWKLVAKAPDKWELYDMEADRSEMNDLCATHPEIAEQMKARYLEWAGNCGVKRK